MPHGAFHYQYKSVSLRSGTITYIEEGSGTTILLLHGAPITSLGFARVIDELRPHYRIVAPDFPGFGRSTAEAGFGGSLREYSAFVREFCESLDLDDLYVYLNDSSACIGLHALSDIAFRINGLIIADTVPIPMTGRAWLVKFVLKYVVTSYPIRFLNRKFNLLPWLVATVAPLKKPFSRDERRALIEQFGTEDKRDRILNIFSQMARDERFIQEAAEKAAVSFDGHSVLLLMGQFDPVRFVGGVSRFQRMFNNDTVRIIPFEEHFPILASGKKVAEAIHFWIRKTASNKGRNIECQRELAAEKSSLL